MTNTITKITLDGNDYKVGEGNEVIYVTQAEYDALPSSKLTDGKHYVIYTADSPTPTRYTITGSTTVGSYSPSSYTDIQGSYISPDGTKMYLIFWNSFNGILVQYSLSTPRDVTTATQVQTLSTAQPDGIYFSNNGDYFYTSRESDHTIKRYSMSTAWDISTATQDQSLSVSNYAYNICLSEDGDYIFFIDNDNCYQYELTTPRDLTSATNQKSTSASGFIGISVRNNGSYLYLTNEGGSSIKQYELATPYDIASNRTEIGSSSSSGDGRGFFVSLDGKYWTFGYSTSNVIQYEAQPIS